MGRRQSSAAEIATTCPYCGVGCGVLVTPDGGGGASVRGDPKHPANLGRLCSKGSALGDTLDLEERLLHPNVSGQESDWDDALDLVAARFQASIAEHGPDSVALYVSGQLLTEDYYVANKLMKGFVGSSNIDTNSRLCMASSVAGHKRAFGSDTVPGRYTDLETADLVVLVGSNLAWCHPVLHQRLLAAKAERGLKLIVIDPRATATSDAADLHLAIKPGADVALFNGLLSHLVDSPAYKPDYIVAHTSGLQDALSAASAQADLVELAATTDLSEDDLRAFFEMVETTEKVVTVYSQGVNQSTAGADKVNAILNCHLATGRIGREGMGPFSVTGQPNAMGGREVGGLANQLAAHMDFAPEDVDRVGRFWDAARMADKPGLKAVDLFDAVADGRIKALWIMATNPVISMPDADKVKAAIEACPFVVVSDVVATSDTLKLADVQLPATAWGEKTGTVTNSERCISRQRSFLPPPGAARHDWDIISDVARRMGFDGFAFEDEAAVFREYAAMTAFENNGARDLDIGAYADVDRQAFDDITPFYWPAPASGSPAPERFFAEGGFYTKDKRARFIATKYRGPADKPKKKYAFIMNTGRVRDHWHTMTRTGKAARLSAHIGEPYLEIHPLDALKLGLKDADLAEVTNKRAACVLRVLVTNRVRQGECFAPFHWTSRYSSHSRVDALVAPNVDPVSGQPESKYTPVDIKPLSPDWHAFMLFRDEPDATQLEPFRYWTKARVKGGWSLECAGDVELADVMSELVGSDDELLSVRDSKTGRYSRARFTAQGALVSLVIAAQTGPVVADRVWLSRQLGEYLDVKARHQLLAGRPPAGEGAGRIVCSCFGVGVNAIQTATKQGASNVEMVGEATCAGTNCGSCKPEINNIIRAFRSTGGSGEQIAAE